jgi:hypothetical protein
MAAAQWTKFSAPTTDRKSSMDQDADQQRRAMPESRSPQVT